MKKLISIFIIFIIIIVGAYFGYKYYTSTYPPTPLACTQEAKICPDGSAVGRTGAKCEFSACPDATANWKIFKDNQYGFELKYPSSFFDENQQPKLLAGDCNYSIFPNKCPNINDIVARDMAEVGGDVNAINSNLSNIGYWDSIDGTKQIINNTNYCLFSTGDAAAGHAFNYYYFLTVKNQKCLVVYLATSTANCDFYLPLEPGNTEQATNYNNCITTNKNQPTILDQIINTFKFTN